ncbi:MFS transporter [Sphingomonas sp. BN140010]|uniref:MFS transporter n=1 Tax=Sphingomonas arvum TaxID=2992113 RepID=A0ABT3JEX2_9SPHN|nr:MFS transporter [Sphingomonas sp. BN140010]MCW3797615.1 MFS transporter [Sphingomonas sp. BN140010]
MATLAVPNDRAWPLRRSLAAMLILTVSIATGFTAMQSFGIMAESAKRELGLSDSALALIQGGGAALPLLVFSVPIGVLIDRRNRVRLMLWLAAIWTFGCFVTAMAANPAILFVGRMLTGIGTTGALTAILSLMADMCLPEQRGRAMLLANLGKSVGIAAGFAVAGWLLGWFGRPGAPAWYGDITPWRSAQYTLGIVSTLLILPLLLLREPARHEVEAGPHAPFRVVAAELWSRRRFLLPLFVGQTSVVMADGAAGIWASPVLERFYGSAPADFGGWLGGIILAQGILGSILGGLLADWGQKSGRKGGLLIGAVFAAIVGVPTALFPIMPDVTGFAVMIGMLMLAGSITGLITSVALTVFLPNELRGLSIGAFIAIAGLIGFGLAPTLVTLVSSLLGGERYLAQALAGVGIVVSAVAVIGFVLAMRRAPEPVARTANAHA